YSLLFSNSNRGLAFTSYGEDSLDSGVEVGYVIYSTQQLINLYFNFVLLLLPLIHYKFSKYKIYGGIASIVIFVLIFSAYYQKRQPLLELGLIFLIYGTLYRKSLSSVLPQKSITYIIVFAFF